LAEKLAFGQSKLAVMDFLKAHEAELDETWRTFDRKCEVQATEIERIKDFMVAEWKTDVCESSAMEESLEEALEKLSTLRSEHCMLEKELHNAQLIKVRNGTSAREFMELQTSKSIKQKILRELFLELEAYKKHETESTIEKQFLAHVIENRKAHVTQIENQLKAEVKRLMDEFSVAWTKALLPKTKFKFLNLQLQTKLSPRIAELQSYLAKKEEELNGIKHELSQFPEKVVLPKNFEQMQQRDELQIRYEALLNEFAKSKKRLEFDSTQIQKLRKKILLTSSRIDDVKKRAAEEFNDMAETNAIHIQMKHNRCKSIKSQMCVPNLDSLIAKEEFLRCKIASVTKKLSNSLEEIADLKKHITKLNVE